MINNFVYAFHAITPIVLLTVIGYYLRKIGFIDKEFAKKANKVVFYVLLPSTLYVNIYQVTDIGEINWAIVGYVILAVIVLFFVAFGTVLLLVPESRQKGVVMQCVFRSNYAIIGLSFAQSLGGSDAVAMVGVLSAFTIPLFNVLAVISMSIFIKGEKSTIDVGSMVKKIVKNPLIIGCALGLLTVFLRGMMPRTASGELVFSIEHDLQFIFTLLHYLANASTAVALIVLGAQFDFGAVKGMFRQIAIGVVGRLVFAPVFGIGLGYLLSSYTNFLTLGKAEYAALLGLFASPVAVSSAVMAGEMDNDAVLAGQLVIWTNVAAIFTVFLTVVVMKMAALI